MGVSSMNGRPLKACREVLYKRGPSPLCGSMPGGGAGFQGRGVQRGGPLEDVGPGGFPRFGGGSVLTARRRSGHCGAMAPPGIGTEGAGQPGGGPGGALADSVAPARSAAP